MQLSTTVDYPVIAVADLHGQRGELGRLVARLEALPEWPECALVFLGDCVDRGDDVPGTIDLVLDLLARRPGRDGGRWARDLDELRAFIPDRHRAFLASLPWVVETPGHLFLHGGLTFPTNRGRSGEMVNDHPRRSPMTRKVYTDEFKIAAAKLVREQGQSTKAAAESLGVDPSSVRNWVRRFAPRSAASTPEASAEELRRENARLREENRRLLMEREILKKATAFFAREQP